MACYPEKHEEAPNMDSDIHYLKQKVANGADYLVTQMFFDNQKYYDFVERCRAEGIQVPIIPGIKPVVFKNQLTVLPKIFRSDIPEPFASELKEVQYRRRGQGSWCGMVYKSMQRSGCTRRSESSFLYYDGNRQCIPCSKESIVNITSVVGATGNPGQGNYAAAKAGLVGMSKSLAYEVASRGITVNCVAPGFIATAMTDKLNDDQKGKILTQIPAGAMGSPTDIAAAILYLSSPGRAMSPVQPCMSTVAWRWFEPILCYGFPAWKMRRLQGGAGCYIPF